MSSTTSNQDQQTRTTATEPQRNERPFVGDKQPKFVIKVQSPIPS